MQNIETAKNTSNNTNFPGRPYYDDKNGTGLCPPCKKVWQLKEQIMYTTINKTRTYGICPVQNKNTVEKETQNKRWLPDTFST